MLGLNPVGKKELRKGELLLREGAPPGYVYYLASGELLVLKSTAIVGKIKAPRFAGEISILLKRPRLASLLAYTRAVVEIYDGPALRSKLALDRNLGTTYLQTLSDRLNMTRDRVSEYQHSILKEYAKTLAGILTERRLAAEWLKPDEAQRVRREYELIYDGRLSHKDAGEDYKALMWAAKEKGIVEEYHKKLNERFRSFAPIDMGQFDVPRPGAAGNFMEDGVKMAEKIAVLTRYMADFQLIDVGCAEWELAIYEDSLPFAEREPLLKETVLASAIASKNLQDLEKRRQAYAVEIRDLAAKADRDTRPLLPLARTFGVEAAYTRSLEKKWNDRLRRLISAAGGSGMR